MFPRTVSGTAFILLVSLFVALIVACGGGAPPPTAPPPPPPAPVITAEEIRDLVQEAVKQSAPEAPAPVDQDQLQWTKTSYKS